MKMEDTFWIENSNYNVANLIREYFIQIDEYSVNDDCTIDVNGDVNFSCEYLRELPITFRVVKGNFDCSKLNLTTLKGSPKVVFGNFNCSFNKLTTLEHAPERVHGTFIFDNFVSDISMLNSSFNEVLLLELTDLPNSRLPRSIVHHSCFLNIILKYQRYYEIWDIDGSLNESNFNYLIDDIKNGLA